MTSRIARFLVPSCLAAIALTTTSASAQNRQPNAPSHPAAGNAGKQSAPQANAQPAASSSNRGGNLNAQELMRQDVWSADNEPLGTITDVIVDAGSGRPVYAVVSTPGLLGSATLMHMVPTATLQRTDNKGLKLPINAYRWTEVPIIAQPAYASGHVNLANFDRDTMTRIFGNDIGLPAANTQLARTNAEPAPQAQPQNRYVNVPNRR